MNKAALIGGIIAIAIGIGVAFSYSSMISENDTTEKTVEIEEVIQLEEPSEENTELEKPLPIEEAETEPETEETEEEGRDLSVELKESIGLKTP